MLVRQVPPPAKIVGGEVRRTVLRTVLIIAISLIFYSKIPNAGNSPFPVHFLQLYNFFVPAHFLCFLLGSSVSFCYVACWPVLGCILHLQERPPLGRGQGTNKDSQLGQGPRQSILLGHFSKPHASIISLVICINCREVAWFWNHRWEEDIVIAPFLKSKIYNK
jgi:hypothetical protein